MCNMVLVQIHFNGSANSFRRFLLKLDTASRLSLMKQSGTRLIKDIQHQGNPRFDGKLLKGSVFAARCLFNTKDNFVLAR
jgi:hypothetical protein